MDEPPVAVHDAADDPIIGDAPGRDRSSWLPAALLLGVVLLGLWGVAAGLAGYRAAQELEVARAELIDAERLLRDAELTLARARLDAAVAASTSAADRLTTPYVMPLRLVPWLGPNLRAATTLSATARDVGGAAAELLDVAAVIVSDDRTQEPGEISLEYLTELAPPARALVTSLEGGVEAVAALDPEPLLGRIVRARELFLELAEPNLAQALVAAELLEVMPAFLGADGPRTYLVGAAALSELRGSGGLLGSWTLMTADGGRMSFEEFVDIDDLPEVSRQVRPPTEEFAERYAGLQSLYNWRTANLSPDFPAVAEVLLALYEQSGDIDLDGVIIADTVVFERLSMRAGGIEVPGFGRVAPEDTLRFVGLDAYDAFDTDEERKRILGATATATFAELFQILEDDDVPATVEMLADIAQGGHLRIYARDDTVQPVLERAGVGGELPTVPGESAGVFLNNFAQNKLDFFEQRTVEHRVRLGEDGSTYAEVVVTLRNDAPTEGHRRGVLGPWVDGVEAGDTRWHVLFTCGIGCELLEEPELDHVGGTERGRTVHDHLTTVRAGQQDHLRYVTRTPDGWTEADGRLEVEVQHLAQPTLRGSTLRLVIEVPEQHRVVEHGRDARVEGDEVVWEGIASGPVSLSVVLEADDASVRATS